MAAFAVAWALLLALATRHRIGRHHDGLLGLAVSTWPGDWRDAWTDGPHANGEVTLHVQLLGHRIVIDYRPR